MRRAFDLAVQLADTVGCVGVLVDAKPDAVAYYERLGFEHLEVVEGALTDASNPTPMFITLDGLPR